MGPGGKGRWFHWLKEITIDNIVFQAEMQLHILTSTQQKIYPQFAGSVKFQWARLVPMLYSGYSGGLTAPPSRLSFRIGRDSAKLPFISKNRQQYVSANANESRLLTWSSRLASWHQARGVITVRAASAAAAAAAVDP